MTRWRKLDKRKRPRRLYAASYGVDHVDPRARPGCGLACAGRASPRLSPALTPGQRHRAAATPWSKNGLIRQCSQGKPGQAMPVCAHVRAHTSPAFIRIMGMAI